MVSFINPSKNLKCPSFFASFHTSNNQVSTSINQIPIENHKPNVITQNSSTAYDKYDIIFDDVEFVDRLLS